MCGNQIWSSKILAEIKALDGNSVNTIVPGTPFRFGEGPGERLAIAVDRWVLFPFPIGGDMGQIGIV